MKRRTHYILFLCTLALSVLCGIMMLRVNVNNDLTKYLPDDSQMKTGLDTIQSEFGSLAQMTGSNVHVMFEGLQPNEVPGIKTLLAGYPNVNGVSFRYSADSTHTLYDLDVPSEVNQKALGKQIRDRFGGSCIVETSQDSATPPISVMVVAAVMIMVVLIYMAQSWFEPVVILLTAGFAILLNVGTNALLPSVSMTTNFIGPILQVVLSLDYCIVLLNRYRQEQNDHMDRDSAVIAANKAIRRAAPSILSSALTTVVGLLMLCFMRLKIGADMGIVLAKGVVCSLICTFTVLPSLMMLFRRVINKTAKPAYVPPTDKLARFISRHKLSMAVGAVMLFAASWFFSQRTTIFFSADQESQIEEVFPSPNPFVIVYRTEDEEHINGLANALVNQPGVQSIISYPTLMSKPLTPKEMASHIYTLLTDYKDMLPEGAKIPPEFLDMLNAEMLEMVYYMHAKDTTQLEMTFPDLARFLHSHVASNPMFAGYLDENMKQQIETLQTMLDVVPEEPEPEPEPVVAVAPKKAPKPIEEEETYNDADTVDLPREVIAPISNEPVSITNVDSLTIPTMEIEKIAVVPFIEKFNAQHPSAITVEMHKLMDTISIRVPMTINEMSLFMGSTQFQTKYVYSYAPKGTQKLTPLQYVHLLKDDIFNRKDLAALISTEQRTQLSQRAYLMDLANENASLTPSEVNMLLRTFGVEGFTEEELMLIANPPKKETPKVAMSVADVNVEEIVQTIAEVQESLHSTDTARAVIVVPEKKVVRVVKHKPTKADLQAELFMELVMSEETYAPAEMAEKLAQLMELSDMESVSISPAQMSLLYDYYGAVNGHCDTMRVGLNPLLNYLCDTLVYDERLADILPADMREQATGIKSQMADGLGRLRKEHYSLFVVLSSLPAESEETYAFVDTLYALANTHIPGNHFLIGESVMYHEMKAGFGAETRTVSLLTILAIFLIVALTFRSVIVPIILVVAVMTAVYFNVVAAGVVAGQMLYLAFLIVQAILMGAAIDYGIVFANYYRENRKTMLPVEAICAAYRGSIRTILTSGLIMVIGPGVMSLFVDDVMISNIVGSIAVGAFMAIVLTLTVVPAVLVALDKWVVYGKKNRFNGETEK